MTFLKSLMTRIIVPIVILFILGITVILVTVKVTSENSLFERTIDTASESIQQFATLRGYYAKNVVAPIKASGAKVRFHSDHKGKPGVAPLPATMILDLEQEYKKKNLQMAMSLYSEKPFPNRVGRVLDSYQKEAIEFFKRNPDETFSKVTGEGDNRIVRVAIADKMVAASCVSCHNTFPGTPKTDWKMGDVRGVLEVGIPVRKAMNDQTALFRTVLFVSIIIVLVVLILVFYTVRKEVQSPIIKVGSDLKSSSKAVLSGSIELGNASNQLSEVSASQSAAVEQTSASLEEMTAVARQSVDKIEEINGLLNKMQSSSEDGGSALNELNNSMEAIILSNEKIQKLADVIAEVGEKTAVIDEIVFQTKLLSFNASVEAERAGEHGRGFAVVAQEVGNLAGLSGKAALEISSIVSESVKSASDVTRTNKELVDSGASKVKSMVSIFEEIKDMVGLVTNLEQEILVISREQSSGIGEITKAMQQIDSSSQRNAQMSSDVSDLGAKLSKVTQKVDSVNTALQKILIKD